VLIIRFKTKYCGVDCVDSVDKQFFTKIFQMLRNCFTIFKLYLGYYVSRETLYLVFLFFGRCFSKIVSRETKMLINKHTDIEKTICGMRPKIVGKNSAHGTFPVG